MDIKSHQGKQLLPDEIHPGEGLLTDTQIKISIDNNLLLVPGTASKEQAKYASYELRISQKVVTLVPDESTAEAEHYHEKTIEYDPEIKITISPNQTLKLFTVEQLNIPANVMAIVLPVGNLYRLGLSPETTFADPGFAGEFWVIVSNYSGRVVELKVGDPLARIQFLKFSGRPDKIHQGASAVRKPETFPKRPARRDLATYENDDTKLIELLTDISGKVDPPHYEHAFVTGAIKRTNANKLNNLEASLKKLRRLAMLLVIFVLIARQ